MCVCAVAELDFELGVGVCTKRDCRYGVNGEERTYAQLREPGLRVCLFTGGGQLFLGFDY